MDHAYNTGFLAFVKSQARWRGAEKQPLNYAAQLTKLLEANSFSSVADTDSLVHAMSDDEAASYGMLRDSFLRKQMTRHRAIERARKAAIDSSRGGEVCYFIASEDGKLKIGSSGNVEKRFDSLQTSASVKLTLLLTIPGGIELETELHRRFVHLRETGEWFRYTEEIKYFIEGAAFYKGLALE